MARLRHRASCGLPIAQQTTADRSAMLRFVWLLSLLGKPAMLFNPLFGF